MRQHMIVKEALYLTKYTYHILFRAFNCHWSSPVLQSPSLFVEATAIEPIKLLTKRESGMAGHFSSPFWSKRVFVVICIDNADDRFLIAVQIAILGCRNEWHWIVTAWSGNTDRVGVFGDLDGRATTSLYFVNSLVKDLLKFIRTLFLCRLYPVPRNKSFCWRPEAVPAISPATVWDARFPKGQNTRYCLYWIQNNRQGTDCTTCPRNFKYCLYSIVFIMMCTGCTACRFPCTEQTVPLANRILTTACSVWCSLRCVLSVPRVYTPAQYSLYCMAPLYLVLPVPYLKSSNMACIIEYCLHGAA